VCSSTSGAASLIRGCSMLLTTASRLPPTST
jgi:hypothetical protein